MPLNNKFRHQTYEPADRPTSCRHLLRATLPPPVGSEAYRERMLEVGRQFRRAGVAMIYLVHGTFVGTDALGLVRRIARVFPKGADLLRPLQKQLVDAMIKDFGNYTPEYAQEYEQSINEDGERHIPVQLFHWSSENHHIGRADGAVRLIDELAKQELNSAQRVLLWGHSHGGNVFALLTNLRGSDRADQRKFFRAARTYYRLPPLGIIDLQIWQRVRSLLTGMGKPLDIELDFVTFGTPVRYGWDTGGYANLLHFIYHRPADGLPPDQAHFPTSIDEVRKAEYGDYIQQFAIAGTNIAPDLLAWRTRIADRNLGRMLQPDLRKRDILTRLKAGIRAHDEGTSLLVDYGPAEGHIGQHIAGHAIYTRLEWLLFHAEETARRIYGKSE